MHNSSKADRPVLNVTRSSEMIFLDVLAIAGIVAGLILVFANW